MGELKLLTKFKVGDRSLERGKVTAKKLDQRLDHGSREGCRGESREATVGRRYVPRH